MYVKTVMRDNAMNSDPNSGSSLGALLFGSSYGDGYALGEN
jgi:hypothetical protein